MGASQPWTLPYAAWKVALVLLAGVVSRYRSLVVGYPVSGPLAVIAAGCLGVGTACLLVAGILALTRRVR